MYNTKILYCLTCGHYSITGWFLSAIPDEPLEEMKCPNCKKKSLIDLKYMAIMEQMIDS